MGLCAGHACDQTVSVIEQLMFHACGSKHWVLLR